MRFIYFFIPFLVLILLGCSPSPQITEEQIEKTTQDIFDDYGTIDYIDYGTTGVGSGSESFIIKANDDSDLFEVSSDGNVTVYETFNASKNSSIAGLNIQDYNSTHWRIGG